MSKLHASVFDAQVDKDLYKRAERSNNWLGLYVVWVHNEKGCMIGITRSDREIPNLFAKFNRHKTGSQIFWSAETERIRWLVRKARRDWRKTFIHGAWYDVWPEEMQRSILDSAREEQIRLRSSEDRKRIIEDACLEAQASLAGEAVLERPPETKRRFLLPFGRRSEPNLIER